MRTPGLSDEALRDWVRRSSLGALSNPPHDDDRLKSLVVEAVAAEFARRDAEAAAKKRVPVDPEEMQIWLDNHMSPDPERQKAAHAIGLRMFFGCSQCFEDALKAADKPLARRYLRAMLTDNLFGEPYGIADRWIDDRLTDEDQAWLARFSGHTRLRLKRLSQYHALPDMRREILDRVDHVPGAGRDAACQIAGRRLAADDAGSASRGLDDAISVVGSGENGSHDSLKGNHPTKQLFPGSFLVRQLRHGARLLSRVWGRHHD